MVKFTKRLAIPVFIAPREVLPNLMVAIKRTGRLNANCTKGGTGVNIAATSGRVQIIDITKLHFKLI